MATPQDTIARERNYDSLQRNQDVATAVAELAIKHTSVTAGKKRGYFRVSFMFMFV